ncbi:MAG TPA: octaprenyl-diphosphate synthase, partial [Steroidobacteraceae bacterium]
GKPTLPLIHALQHGTDQQRAIIRDAIQKGGIARLEPVIAAIDATGGLEYATRLAREHAAQAQAALGALPESACRKGLAALAAFSVEHTT